MRKTLIAGAALVVAAGAVFFLERGHHASPAHDANLVRDRVWCDHIPRSETDKMNVFVALSRQPRRPPIGIFEQVSMWEGHFEAFTYEQNGDEMRIVLPQSGDRESITVKARTCNEAGMDYCLEMSESSRGVKRYYSRKGWEVRSVDEASALAQKLEAPPVTQR